MSSCGCQVTSLQSAYRCRNFEWVRTNFQTICTLGYRCRFVLLPFTRRIWPNAAICRIEQWESGYWSCVDFQKPFILYSSWAERWSPWHANVARDWAGGWDSSCLLRALVCRNRGLVTSYHSSDKYWRSYYGNSGNFRWPVLEPVPSGVIMSVVPVAGSARVLGISGMGWQSVSWARTTSYSNGKLLRSVKSCWCLCPGCLLGCFTPGRMPLVWLSFGNQVAPSEGGKCAAHVYEEFHAPVEVTHARDLGKSREASCGACAVLWVDNWACQSGCFGWADRDRTWHLSECPSAA